MTLENLIFNRKYIFKWWMFYCHVSFGGGKRPAIFFWITSFSDGEKHQLTGLGYFQSKFLLKWMTFFVGKNWVFEHGELEDG